VKDWRFPSSFIPPPWVERQNTITRQEVDEKVAYYTQRNEGHAIIALALWGFIAWGLYWVYDNFRIFDGIADFLEVQVSEEEDYYYLGSIEYIDGKVISNDLFQKDDQNRIYTRLRDEGAGVRNDKFGIQIRLKHERLPGGIAYAKQVENKRIYDNKSRQYSAYEKYSAYFPTWSEPHAIGGGAKFLHETLSVPLWLIWLVYMFFAWTDALLPYVGGFMCFMLAVFTLNRRIARDEQAG
jgi:hypothetical protein